MTATRKRALAEGFPALHEVVSACGWVHIPREIVGLLDALAKKARVTSRCSQVCVIPMSQRLHK
jgi:hypothetical protein